MDEAFGTVDGTGLVEGPRQPLSRSLPGGKNPVSVLMEFSQRTGSSIEFINTGQEGPPHDPRYGSLLSGPGFSPLSLCP